MTLHADDDVFVSAEEFAVIVAIATAQGAVFLAEHVAEFAKGFVQDQAAENTAEDTFLPQEDLLPIGWMTWIGSILLQLEQDEEAEEIESTVPSDEDTVPSNAAHQGTEPKSQKRCLHDTSSKRQKNQSLGISP